MLSAGAVVMLVAFLAAFLGIFTVNLVLVDLFQRDRSATLERLNEELMEEQRRLARQKAGGAASDELGGLAHEAEGEIHRRVSLLEKIEELAAQSGLRITTGKLLGMTVVTGLLVAAAVGAIARDPIIGGLAGAVAAGIPFLYVSAARRKRLDKLRGQLPDAFELMSRVMRAGQSITQAIKAVSEEFPPPVMIEFGYCYEQQNLGLSPEVALHDLARRTGLLEIKIFVLAVLVHRQAGGNLTLMLDNIAKVVRDRFRMRAEVKGLTAEGRLQAAVLLGLPIAVWIGLYFVSRDYATSLFDHPSLLISTLTVMFVGAVWIRHIVNFDF